MGVWLAALLCAAAADIDPLLPSGSLPGGSGTPWLEDAWLGDAGVSASLGVGYLHAPMVLTTTDDERLGARDYVPLALHVGWTFGTRGRLDMHLPFYAWADVPFTNHRSPAIGDLEMSGLIPVFQHSRLFGISLEPRLSLPSGSGDALVRRGVAGTLSVVMSGEHEVGVGYTTQLGFTGSPTQQLNDRILGSTFDVGAGVWWRLHERFRVGGDLVGAAGLVGGDRANHHLSAHLFAQLIHESGVGLTLAGGTGLTRSIGAPRGRVLASLTWTPTRRDQDRDGLRDDEDRCPNEAEDVDGHKDADGCPDPDNDGDGFADVEDRCPALAEDLDDFEDTDGCPEVDNDLDGLGDDVDLCPLHAGPAQAYGCPDTDGDHMVDPEDLCPEEPGPTNTFGCPDADGDRVPDRTDACPDIPTLDEPGTSDGCPTGQAALQGDRIELAAKIEFETGRATILEGSTELLQDAAQVLADHPELLRVEIAGHTDAEGSRDANLRLSEARAQAVKAFLVEQGIDPQRLVAKGYGPDNPIDTNRTQRGRAANRRVELAVIERE